MTAQAKPWHRWFSLALCALFICPVFFLFASPVEASAAGVNVLDRVGYVDNTRLSTSDGSEKTEAGYVTSGLIDVSSYTDGCVVKVYGVSFDMTTYAHVLLHTYNADGSYFNSFSLNTEGQNGVDFSIDESGVLTMTFDEMDTMAENMKYFRITGYGSGADFEVNIKTYNPVLSATTGIVTFGMSSVSKLAEVIINNPLLLCFIALPLVGLGVGLFKRMRG